MAQPRYQVFVSSTFRDLREERQTVLDAILELDHFPAGMEIFPAADATPWELIESIIQQSDYYILIVGGVYGSTSEDGISYTEKEFDFATKLGKPILAFIHENPADIPVGKSDLDPGPRMKLAAFRKKVEKHHCKYWKDKADLKSKAITGLVWAIRTSPAVGWVRADGVDNTDLLARLADLQRRHDLLAEENKRLGESLGIDAVREDIASGDEQVSIDFAFHHQNSIHQIKLSWDETFYGIGEVLLSPTEWYRIRNAFSYVIFGAFNGTPKFQELTGAASVGKEYWQDKCLILDRS
ncbi:MAG TPA: DUF4062 domain-containing protein, partial [Gemmataceae bacterium]|nr:DUF4062 domain-containing protein [Gemmataceae bacterium]